MTKEAFISYARYIPEIDSWLKHFADINENHMDGRLLMGARLFFSCPLESCHEEKTKSGRSDIDIHSLNSQIDVDSMKGENS
jgi:hypothetical protein